MGWLVFDWQDPRYFGKNTQCKWCNSGRGCFTPSGESRFYPLCHDCFYNKYNSGWNGAQSWEELCTREENKKNYAAHSYRRRNLGVVDNVDDPLFDITVENIIK